MIVPAPRLASQYHGRVAAIRFHRIDARNAVPIDNPCGSADDIVLVEALPDTDESIEAWKVEMVF